MKSLLLIVLLLVTFASNSQTGSISGNVFWKYNDFVGNKADAGSEITLISIEKPEIKFKTTSDLQGNYKFESLNPDRYFLTIKSKNTRQNPLMFSRLFKVYKLQLDTILNIKISEFKTDIQNQIDSLYNYQIELIQKYSRNEIKMGKYLKENGKIDNEILKKTEEWFKLMPTDYKIKLDAFSHVHESFHYQIINVAPGKNETIVTDFGITYL